MGNKHHREVLFPDNHDFFENTGNAAAEPTKGFHNGAGHTILELFILVYW